MNELAAQDILAFQECTSPADMEGLLETASPSKHRMFIHHNLNVSGVSTDNVVLAFDTDKYQLAEQAHPKNPLKEKFEGKKPALYCKLQEISTGRVFIVGSIHHPGRRHDLRHEIESHVKLLQAGDDAMPCYIAGDYNHTAEQFSAREAGVPLFYSSEGGTMSGSDYDNTNHAIDAIMSNQALTGHVRASLAITLAPPAPMPLEVSLDVFSQTKPAVVDGVLKPHITICQPIFKNKAKAIKGALIGIHEEGEAGLGERIILAKFN
ncbi:MAG: hypothetical protein K0U24_04455 [Gammaproteobacteria bacterium]|nr:hypothetical protein [Gammaproteobacteria bacterium]MCH9763467.1 hypothetical protein [Gammaproteobacteria bacterium]